MVVSCTCGLQGEYNAICKGKGKEGRHNGWKVEWEQEWEGVLIAGKVHDEVDWGTEKKSERNQE